MRDSLVFVGTYSQRGSKGIYALRVAADTGAMTVVGSTPARDASFLCTSPDNRFLFAVSETGDRPDGAKGSAVNSFAINGPSLTPINEQNVNGTYCCHVACSPDGKWIICSNYGDGTHTILPVSATGVIGKPTDFFTNPGTPGPNQQSGHAHHAIFTPDGKFIYVCDLGLDIVGVYRFDNEHGRTQFASAASLPPGAGPRHIALHPKLPMAYVISELNSTVTVFARNTDTGALTVKQTLDTLPANVAQDRRAGKFHTSCAEVVLSADGQTLYGSNRGHDSLAVFAVDKKTGELTATGYVSTEGKNPRHFCLIPKTSVLLAANQDGDNIVAFRHNDKAGDVPKPTGEKLAIPAPVCVWPVP